MTDLIYSTGTVSVSANGTVVAALGGPLWASNVQEYDTLIVTGVGSAKILGVTDDTHLTISEWPHGAVTSGAYEIIQDSVLRFNGSQTSTAVTALVTALDVSGFYIFVAPALTTPDPSSGDEGQFARQPSTGKEWLKTGGIWVFQGITGNLSFTSTAWAVGTTYSLNVIVPFAGKLWISLQAANVGNQPDTSPTWWAQFLAGGDTVYVAMDDSDRPASGETVLKFVSPKAMTIFSGMTDSYAKAATGATLSAVYSIQKNGSQFGTITFAAAGQGGAQTGTFSCASNAVFAAGDILTLVAPTPRDATLSTIGITITGYR